jgi:hypothetical protein
MSIEGSKEVFLVGTVEDTRKAFKGGSKCDLERVIVIRSESVADRREAVTKEAKLLGVGGLLGEESWMEERNKHWPAE